MQERQRIGETLRAARLAKGVSLEEAAEATRIRRSALQALESDEFDALPASVYTRGFLVNYARYLGLIAEEIAEEFDRQQRDSTETPVGEPQEEHAGRSSLFSLKFLLAFVFMIVLGVILNFVYQEYLSAGPAPIVTESEPTPTTEPTPLVQIPPLRTPSPIPTPEQPPTPTPVIVTGVNVTLRSTTQQAWLSVTADGEVIYVNTIGPETDQGTEPLTWSATESISITFGRTAGVEITVNGSEVGPLVESENAVVFEAVESDDGELVIAVNGTPIPTPE